MSDNVYYIDDEPVRWSVLIERAAELDEAYRRDSFKTTSQAAFILRAAGHSVTDKPRWRKLMEEQT